MPERAPINATCEEVYEPLPVIIERQRARADKMLLEPPFSEVVPSRGNGSGNGDDTAG
jgi:hypothetical protein